MNVGLQDGQGLRGDSAWGRWLARGAGLACAAALLAGCAGSAPKAPEPVADAVPACQPAADGSLVGNWLGSRKQRGVTGEIRTLITLRADGTMDYVEQNLRPRKPPQSLTESGCWQREGGELVLRTLTSNGSPVEMGDPIYTNRYAIVSAGAKSLVLTLAPGQRWSAKRMDDAYRLPY